MEYTKFYEPMRPRYNNLTYNSNHVGASLGSVFIPPKQPIDRQSNNPIAYSPKPQPKNESITRRNNSMSHLSTYGSQILNPLNKQITDRDIYQKQNKRYNIISIMPVQYNETIKKYPKFHLEDIDKNYYKKVQLEGQYHQQQNLKYSRQFQQRVQNPENNNMSNQVSQVNQINYRQPAAGYQNNKLGYGNQGEKIGSFRAKMLNNIDQLGGVL